MALLMSHDSTLADAQAGSPAAFEALLAPLLDPAYRLACVLLQDRTEAEDAVQEAALKGWSRLGQLRDRSQVRSWFLSVVANECRMARRRPWWRVIRLPLPEATPAGGEDEVVRGLDLERAIRALPDDDRLALFAHYYLDLSLEETARVLGVSLPTAKSRVYRAARRLRPGLAQEEVTSRS